MIRIEPYPSEAWQNKVKEDWYRDYVNRGHDNPPRGVDPDAWRCATLCLGKT